MGVSAPIIKVSVPSINLVQYKLPLNHLAKVIASEVDIDPTSEVGNSNRVRSGFSKRSIEDRKYCNKITKFTERDFFKRYI